MIARQMSLPGTVPAAIMDNGNNRNDAVPQERMKIHKHAGVKFCELQRPVIGNVSCVGQ